jgi:23S rRNA maturation mini-RNase III
LEDLAAETGNVIAISVTDLSKLKTQATKKATTQESETESKEDLLKESRNQKKTTTTKKEQKPDFSNQLGFSLEVVGEYRNLVDFFAKLENLPYLVQVYSFQMTPLLKNQAISQSSVSGVNQVSPSPSSSSNPSNPEEEKENKNIKAILVIGVYTHGAQK